MKKEGEAVHFLKFAEFLTDKKCFVRLTKISKFEKWKIFTSKEDYYSFIKYRKQIRYLYKNKK
jgi:hypothetical protein